MGLTLDFPVISTDFPELVSPGIPGKYQSLYFPNDAGDYTPTYYPENVHRDVWSPIPHLFEDEFLLADLAVEESSTLAAPYGAFNIPRGQKDVAHPSGLDCPIVNWPMSADCIATYPLGGPGVSDALPSHAAYVEFPSACGNSTTMTHHMEVPVPQVESVHEVGSERITASAKKRQQKVAEFQCQFCSATFTAKHNLKYHVNAHFGLRPYRCELEGCAYGSTDPSTLKRHRRSCELKSLESRVNGRA